MSERTLQALRQVVVATLQSPPLTYPDQTGMLVTLDPSSIYSRQMYQQEKPPSPAIVFSVSGSGGIGRIPGERILRIGFVILSSNGSDEATDIYDALRPRFHLADQEAPQGVTDISRCPEGAALGISVRQCIETMVDPISFQSSTQRWYLAASYRVHAI